MSTVYVVADVQVQLFSAFCQDEIFKQDPPPGAGLEQLQCLMTHCVASLQGCNGRDFAFQRRHEMT